MGDDLDPFLGLVEILRLAYSGELAAARAYRGHWRSLRSPALRDRIRQIEDEEWHHRRQVGAMLETLGRKPSLVRELRAEIVGRVLGTLCHVVGWLPPMYGAGRLESRNIVEYETAARYAERARHGELTDCLLTMAEVEWEHEAFFRAQVMSRRRAGRLSIWPAPAPKEEIRASFSREFQQGSVECPSPTGWIMQRASSLPPGTAS